MLRSRSRKRQKFFHLPVGRFAALPGSLHCLDRGEGLLQIFYQVVHMLNPD